MPSPVPQSRVNELKTRDLVGRVVSGKFGFLDSVDRISESQNSAIRPQRASRQLPKEALVSWLWKLEAGPREFARGYRSLIQTSCKTVSGFLSVVPPAVIVTMYVPGVTGGPALPRPPRWPPPWPP